MLRRTTCFFLVHRTLTGVTITNPEAVSALDAAAAAASSKSSSSSSSSSSAAEYWTSLQMVKDQKRFLVSHTIEHSMMSSTNNNSSKKSVSVPLSSVYTPSEAAAFSGGVSSSSTTTELFNTRDISAASRQQVDEFSLVPQHVDAMTGKIFVRQVQPILEAICVANKYSSTTWYSLFHLSKLQDEKRVRTNAKSVPIFSLANKKEDMFYNADEIVDMFAARQEFLQKEKQQEQEHHHHHQLHHQQNAQQQVQEGGETTTTVDPLSLIHAESSKSSNVGALCRSGRNAPFPDFIQHQLQKLRKERNLNSTKFYTLRQARESTLRPRVGEEHTPVEVISEEGGLIVMFAESSLELGSLNEKQVENYRPKATLATAEQERNAARTNNFLDGRGQVIFQPERKAAVMAAFSKRVERLARDHAAAASTSSSFGKFDQQQENTLAASKKGSKKKTAVGGGGGRKSSSSLASSSSSSSSSSAIASTCSRQWLTSWEVLSLGFELKYESAKACDASFPPAEYLDSFSGRRVTLYSRDQIVDPKLKIDTKAA